MKTTFYTVAYASVCLFTNKIQALPLAGVTLNGDSPNLAEIDTYGIYDVTRTYNDENGPVSKRLYLETVPKLEFGNPRYQPYKLFTDLKEYWNSL